MSGGLEINDLSFRELLSPDSICPFRRKLTFYKKMFRLYLSMYDSVYIRVGWKVDMITYLLLMTLLTSGIQTLQHWWKKRVDCKGDYEGGLKSSYDDIFIIEDFFG